VRSKKGSRSEKGRGEEREKEREKKQFQDLRKEEGTVSRSKKG
jgi:hypothetical protein